MNMDFNDEQTTSEALESLIELGLVGFAGVNEEGDITYELTELGERYMETHANDFS